MKPTYFSFCRDEPKECDTKVLIISCHRAVGATAYRRAVRRRVEQQKRTDNDPQPHELILGRRAAPRRVLIYSLVLVLTQFVY